MMIEIGDAHGGFLLPPDTPAEIVASIRQMYELKQFRRLAFAVAPFEVRLLDGRRQRGQDRFPQTDADATGVP